MIRFFAVFICIILSIAVVPMVQASETFAARQQILQELIQQRAEALHLGNTYLVMELNKSIQNLRQDLISQTTEDTESDRIYLAETKKQTVKEIQPETSAYLKRGTAFSKKDTETSPAEKYKYEVLDGI